MVIIKYYIIRFISLILVFLFVSNKAGGQSLFRYLEMSVDEFRLNKSPVKNHFDLSDYSLLPQQMNDKYGYVNGATGDTVIAFQYDSAGYFEDGLAVVQMNGKWGFVNKYGKQVIACLYDSTGYFNSGICLVKKGKFCGYINKAGKEIIPCEYTELIPDEEGLVWMKKNEKYGLYNANGVQLSAPRFNSFQSFREGLAWVQVDEKWSFINKEGVMLIPPKYEEADFFYEGMARVREFESYGFINKNGEMTVNDMYENAENFNEGLAAVKVNLEGGSRSWIYLNKKEEWMITNEGKGFTRAGSFSNGFARVEKGEDSAGIIDKSGKEIIPCEYEEIGELSDSMVAVKKYRKWGYCNLKGELIISCRFDEAYRFANGLALVTSGDSYYINKKGDFVKAVKNSIDGEEDTDKESNRRDQLTIDYINTRGEKVILGKQGVLSSIFFNNMTPLIMNSKCGFMNKEGVVAISCMYDSAGSFNEGLATVRMNKKWGFIYQDGDTLTSCRFEYAYNFHKGLAIVKMYGKYGYLAKTGELLIPYNFDMAYTFKDSLAIIRIGTHFGFINKEGVPIIPCQYDDVFDFHEGLAAVQKEGLWGYINRQGNIVIPFRYEEAFDFHEGLAGVMKEGKMGYIDRTGSTVIAFRYKTALTFNQGTAFVEDTDGEMLSIDTKGNELFAGNFLSGFFENLALVQNDDNKKGFINRKGIQVIPCQYDDAMIFREGLAAVEINKKWGFINQQGTVVIPCQFDGAFFFNEGLGLVFNINK